VWEQGLIAHLRVPRARQRVEDSRILERYKRRQKQVNELVREMFLAGVSTRRVGEVLQPILGETISASTVSNILKALDREVAAFLSRPIEDNFVYLLLDGITLKIQSPQGVQKKLVLVAYGINEQGQRQIISFRLPRQRVKSSGGSSSIICSTGGCRANRSVWRSPMVVLACTRLWTSCIPMFPGRDAGPISCVMCRTSCPSDGSGHARRHCTGLVCLAPGASIKQKPSEMPGLGSSRVPRRGTRNSTKSVECIERELNELSCFARWPEPLSFLVCPKEDWKKVRTTNAIERSFREVRRRTKPMSCFTNAESCRRIIYGIVTHLNTHWKKHRRSRKSTQKS